MKWRDFCVGAQDRLRLTHDGQLVKGARRQSTTQKVFRLQLTSRNTAGADYSVICFSIIINDHVPVGGVAAVGRLPFYYLPVGAVA